MSKAVFLSILLFCCILVQASCRADNLFSVLNQVNPYSSYQGTPYGTGVYQNVAPDYYNQYPNQYNSQYSGNGYGYPYHYCTPPPVYRNVYNSYNPYYNPLPLGSGVQNQLVRNIGGNLLYSLMNH